MSVSEPRPHERGSLTISEIANQPESWARAIEQSTRVAGALPRADERVLVLGCGTSYYAGDAYARIREGIGAGETDAIIASELPPRLRRYDRALVISRSGTTMDLVNALKRLPAGLPVTAILGQLDTPIERLATDIVDLSYADDLSVVQTRFPTTVLSLLRASVGGFQGDEVERLLGSAKAAVAEPVDDPVPRQLVVLGSGWAAALAQEAALKSREAAGVWAEAYASGEYRHGPIGSADSGTLVWAITPLTVRETDAIAEAGARLRQGTRDPMVELISLQRRAAAWAAARGRDADLPPHLSRSVVAL